MDNDLYKTTPFNLELMKLSTYYKKKRQIVALSPEFKPNYYSDFYLRKDFEDGIYPSHLELFDNVEFGGHGFSGHHYVPLPSEIEGCKPDVTIYERVKNNYKSEKWLQQAFSVMGNARHVRFSLDGKTVWPDYEKQLSELGARTKTLFIHDYNINEIPDARSEIRKLYKVMDKGIGAYVAFKFPITISRLEDLQFWYSFQASANFFAITWRGLMEDEILFDFVNTTLQKGSPCLINYIVTAGFKDQNDFLENGLLKIYNQVLFLRMAKVKILLKYEHNFFIDKKWEKLIDLFNSFMTVTINNRQIVYERDLLEDSLYKFVKHFKNENIYKREGFISRNEARELFQLVRETNYELFTYFYNAHIVQFVGGIFVNDGIQSNKEKD